MGKKHKKYKPEWRTVDGGECVARARTLLGLFILALDELTAIKKKNNNNKQLNRGL